MVRKIWTRSADQRSLSADNRADRSGGNSLCLLLAGIKARYREILIMLRDERARAIIHGIEKKKDIVHITGNISL